MASRSAPSLVSCSFYYPNIWLRFHFKSVRDSVQPCSLTRCFILSIIPLICPQILADTAEWMSSDSDPSSMFVSQLYSSRTIKRFGISERFWAGNSLSLEPPNTPEAFSIVATGLRSLITVSSSVRVSRWVCLCVCARGHDHLSCEGIVLYISGLIGEVK